MSKRSQSLVFESGITSVGQVKDERAKSFARLGIQTVAQLLTNFPRYYIDLSQKVKIQELSSEKTQTVIAQVTKFRNIYLRGKGGRSMQKATLTDESGSIDAIWFNMPFLADTIKVDQWYAFTAKVYTNKKSGINQLASPGVEKYSPQTEDKLIHSGRIVPVYRLTAGLSPRIYRRVVDSALQNLHDPEISNEIGDCIKQVHFPDSDESLAKAKFRLGVEELIPIQRKLSAQAKLLQLADTPADFRQPAARKEEYIANFWKSFDFTPTMDQLKVCSELWQDFVRNKPMYRLLQGDVGSGKTAVAMFATQLTLECKCDVLVMVPTTILANQHYISFSKIFPNQVELLTAGTKSQLGELTEKMRSTRAPRVIIGTQALLHHYQELNLHTGLLIVDEEHRFGVAQRQEIAKIQSGEGFMQAIMPHYLSLTATPIPRTLALAIFGNISLSVIATKPQKQLTRITYVVPEPKRTDSLKWLKGLVQDKGYQAFWICPLIEEEKQVDSLPVLMPASEKSSVEKKYKQLVECYPELRLGQLHGKMTQAQKTEVLDNFRLGNIDILVSTTVIEVGIDIPNANAIVIESAEKFGLAQLHQLRGRVGRGDKQGYCLLYSTSESESAAERLDYFAHEQDGLHLAEFDLKYRGPGEVYGTVQSGIPNLRIADILSPEQIMSAKSILETDPGYKSILELD